MILSDLLKSDSFEPLSRETLEAQLNDFNNSRTASGFSTSTYFSNITNQNVDILRGYLDTVENMEEASIDGLVAYQERVIEDSSENATKAFAIASNVVKNIAIAAAVELGIYAINKLVETLSFTPQHKEKIAKLAEEAKTAFNDKLSENSDNLASVEQMTEEFNRLSQGVSRMGENLSLTNNQYDTYKYYVEQLIKINPSLVEGINAQGDAFINNTNAINDTIAALKEQQRVLYADFFNGTDDLNALENYHNEFTAISGKINEITASENGGSILPNLQLLRENLIALQEAYEAEGNLKSNDIAKLIQDAGLTSKNDIQQNYEQVMQNIHNMNSEFDSLLSADTSKMSGKFKNYYEAIGKNISNNEELIVAYKQEQEKLDSLMDNYDEIVVKYARSRTEYANFNDFQLKLLNQFIEDYGFGDKIGGKMTESGRKQVENDMKQDVREFVSFLSMLSQDTNEAIQKFSTLDKSKTLYGDYRYAVDDVLNQIKEDPNYNPDLISDEQIKLAIGVSFETSDGQIHDAYNEMVDNIVARFEQNALKGIPDNYIKQAKDAIYRNIDELLTPDQITKLYDAEDSNIFSSWNKAYDYVNISQGFDIKTYQDSIDDLTKSLSTLGDAYKKVKAGEFTTDTKGATEEVMNLVKEFPELAEYVDYNDKHFGRLRQGLIHLINTSPDKLLDNIAQLGTLAAEDQKKVEQLRASVKGLINDAMGYTPNTKYSVLVNEGLTESDYLEYVNHDYDQIIKKLEKEKEKTEDVNDELEKQKETLDKIVDEYEIAGNTVIKALDDKIDDVTEYYDEQINKLKEENEEIEKNIDLQKKRDALANARKNKVRVYSETEGWHYEKNVTAIEEAENELAKAEREVKIQELEKERDTEIKLWEDYKKAWEDAMESYTKAHDEAITDGILGSEWRENVMARDEEMLNTYQQNYFNFKNQLDTNIDEQIKKNKEYVDSIDKKIKKYNDEKQQFQDYVDDIKYKSLKYFEIIDNVKITENSTYEERMKNLAEFKENYIGMLDEINAANENVKGLPLDDNPKFRLAYTGSNQKAYSSQLLTKEFDTYESAEEAEKALAAEIKKDLINGLPFDQRIPSVLNKLTEEILKDISIEFAHGSYANGGVIDYTGNAAVHGSPSHAEVALNSSQGREVYEFIKSGMLTKATSAMAAAYNALVDILPKPSLGNLGLANVSIKNPMSGINPVAAGGDNSVVVQFQNPVIYAENYEQFDAYMSKYMNQALLELQVKK